MATTNESLLTATDEEVARLNKILKHQLIMKTIFQIAGGVTLAVVSGVITNAINQKFIDDNTNEVTTD